MSQDAPAPSEQPSVAVVHPQDLQVTVDQVQEVIDGISNLLGGRKLTKALIVRVIANCMSIAQMTGIAAKVGFGYFLYFVALISANLAVINLIPVPALDGGRLLMVAIETVARKKLSSKVVGWVTGISFLLLILLIIFITVHDIRNLF
jgi:regulator of sigma E protease